MKNEVLASVALAAEDWGTCPECGEETYLVKGRTLHGDGFESCQDKRPEEAPNA